jgi:hypothetical protein
MNNLNKIVKIIKDQKMVREVISMLYSGYLNELGWNISFKTKMPFDKNNNPIPWVTYPFIDFLEPRLNSQLNLLEYGSGSSTLFYSKRVKSVVAVEHEKEWIEKIKLSLPANVSIIQENLEYNGEYSKASLKTGKKFHLIIVDGRDRVNCLINSISSLTDDGVMILDDSEREEYANGVQKILENNYKKLDFWGIAPGLIYKKCTSIFYKNSNCLGI